VKGLVALKDEINLSKVVACFNHQVWVVIDLGIYKCSSALSEEIDVFDGIILFIDIVSLFDSQWPQKRSNEGYEMWRLLPKEVNLLNDLLMH